MILYTVGMGLYEVKRALLEQVDGSSLKLPRFFSTSEQLIAFLSNAPGVKFALSAVGTATVADDLLSNTAADAYGPQFGDVLCGLILYDGTKKQVLTVGTYVGSDVNRIFGG
ncbi:hypothetical protein LJ656_23855 [Paraburkholderia sp. MMS20-SJTR3]|uniref:Uncharacterized protein n=1 Tax=Paraburkholderia sejongensis TaxID=2886946 RepID=A0ABS8K0E3_9BURK|nr:hypothetical protein [Paraburkholderia sp. MMS20-SJTR3]MCC8395620.1 hypothetical protein [Paraburkholderia sp. MMS20-SJTR3]